MDPVATQNRRANPQTVQVQRSVRYRLNHGEGNLPFLIVKTKQNHVEKLLQRLGIEVPPIQLLNKGNLKVEREPHRWKLSVNGRQWMQLNANYKEAFEFYSHVDLAKGHCICTGLGFAIREASLLAKPEVTKVTVLEKNKEVIDYHRYTNPGLLEKLEVIHTDANTYVGQCDTLLIDHFEEEVHLSHPYIFCTVKEIAKNIKHQTMWFWPLEMYITKLELPYGASGWDRYLAYREEYPTLPDLLPGELMAYCSVYSMSNL